MRKNLRYYVRKVIDLQQNPDLILNLTQEKEFLKLVKKISFKDLKNAPWNPKIMKLLVSVTQILHQIKDMHYLDIVQEKTLKLNIIQNPNILAH